MIIQHSQPPTAWSSIHAKDLRDFLASETGKLALQWVVFNAPELLDGADVNKTLVRSGEVKGYSLSVTRLIELTVEQPVEAAAETNYPDLDNDHAWNS